MTMAILFGCSAQNNINHNIREYSFDDPNVIAYVDGNTVYKDQCEQYIEFKKLMMEEYKDLDDPTIMSDDVEYIDMERLANKGLSFYKRYAQKYLSLSDKDRIKDYYISFIIKNKLKEIINKGTKDYYESNFIFGIEYEVNSVLAKDETVFNIEVTTIESIAEKYNMTFEDATQKIYRPWLESDSAFFMLLQLYPDNGYAGEVMKWDETNTEEYIIYCDIVFEEYLKYTGELLDHAEIVERS
jgi:hypothetical protein